MPRSATPRFTTLNLRRLRLAVLIFFFALATPALFLMHQAHRQLKWETVHQYRSLAEEFSARINQQIKDWTWAEEQRPFTDYSFLNLAGDPRANFVQRSPLAVLPVPSNWPGAMGYFQIDPHGRLTSPLLPGSQEQTAALGLNDNDLQQRRQVENQLRAILASNALLTTQLRPDSHPPANAAAEQHPAATAGRTIAEAEPAVPSTLAAEQTTAAPGTLAEARNRTLHKTTAPAATATTGTLTDRPSVASATAAGEPATDDDAELGFAQLQQRLQSQAASPARHQEQKQESQEQKEARRERATYANPAASQRVELSVLLEGATTPVAQQPQAAESPPGAATAPQRHRQQPDSTGDKRTDRNNTTASEAEAHPAAGAGQTAATIRPPAPAVDSAVDSDGLRQKPPQNRYQADLQQTELRVHTFESIIDPFQFSRLQSGHFVLFRSVWRDGQRYFQGLLIDADRWVRDYLAQEFLGTALAEMSNLQVRHQQEKLDTILGPIGYPYASPTPADTHAGGEELLTTQLTPPLSELQLFFSLRQLPAGPGARVIAWSGGLYLLVLALGCALLYHTGRRHIELAQQQQDFVAAVSHELKTPLTSIRMYGEMLSAGWVPEEKKQQYYHYIHDEGERLSRLIDNVLQLARMNRSELQLNPKPISLASVLDVIHAKIVRGIEQAGFEFQLKCPPAMMDEQVIVDLDALTQVIINLVDNALKFSAHAPQRCLAMQVSRHDTNHIALQIRDHGPGIPRDQIKKIFQLFYRSENELTRETVGTGIGLALVHQLMYAMNGRVTVANARPGAAFTLLMKRQRDTASN